MKTRISNNLESSIGAVRCRYSTSGCNYRLPSMEFHEERECRFRPTRCPSLTCPIKPPYARLMEHIRVGFYVSRLRE